MDETESSETPTLRPNSLPLDLRARTPDAATQPTFVFIIPFIMLARSALARIPAHQAVLGTAPQNARNMATLREIELRLKSVKNIEKITKVRV